MSRLRFLGLFTEDTGLDQKYPKVNTKRKGRKQNREGKLKLKTISNSPLGSNLIISLLIEKKPLCQWSNNAVTADFGVPSSRHGGMREISSPRGRSGHSPLWHRYVEPPVQHCPAFHFHNKPKAYILIKSYQQLKTGSHLLEAILKSSKIQYRHTISLINL